MSASATLTWHTFVSTNYQMFWLHDPTCEESENLARAFSAASREVVGWATNAVAVEVAADKVGIDVRIELFDEAPNGDPAAELLRHGQIEIPGGSVSIPYSLDEAFQRGMELPNGPGTYGVLVFGYGRTKARRLQEQGVHAGGQADAEANVNAFEEAEGYRILLWQVASNPRWEDDEDD